MISPVHARIPMICPWCVYIVYGLWYIYIYAYSIIFLLLPSSYHPPSSKDSAWPLLMDLWKKTGGFKGINIRRAEDPVILISSIHTWPGASVNFVKASTYSISENIWDISEWHLQYPSITGLLILPIQAHIHASFWVLSSDFSIFCAHSSSASSSSSSSPFEASAALALASSALASLGSGLTGVEVYCQYGSPLPVAQSGVTWLTSEGLKGYLCGNFMMIVVTLAS